MAGYLKVGDIKGESTDDGHKDWINLLSVSHNITRPMGAGASGSTRHRSSATFGDVVCVKEVDASTPKLQEAVADGTNFPKVQIDLCTSSEGGKRIPYVLWELKQARVSSYSVSGATDGSMVPTEQLSFNFEEIKVTYDKLGKDNKSKGKVDYSWKVEEGVK
jgi:type VI secretion system secreted protein Hcp